MRVLSILSACCIVTGATSIALRTDNGGAHWWYMLLPYTLISAAVAITGRGRVAVVPTLRYRRGDLSLGAAVGGGLLAIGWLVPQYLLPPGADGRAWLFQILLASDGVARVEGTIAFAALVAMEEWVWRGWIQTELAVWLSSRWAWFGSAVLYCAVHLPTVLTLADGDAGPNPLLAVAALGLGASLGLLRRTTGRLMPGIFAHLVFSYFGATWLLRV